ncbi:MAG: galactokinase [Trueperaceae bacterium]|nr:galactokinase [Trueperaceae bacterium]
MSNLKHIIETKFTEKFSEMPSVIVRAPGRVNLIGEHTDYNDGFVMPMAIDRSMWIGLRPRNDQKVKIYSIDFDVWAEFSLDALEKDTGFQEYLKGMAWALQEAGHQLGGWEGVMTGDVPRGSGLSSSAALELATARAFYEVSSFDWNPKEMALLGQKCENQWVGANTGIMDQLISATGQKGYALKIDCRSLDLEPVTLPQGTAIVVMDTMTRHAHTDSGYNERRAQCEEAARHFGVKALRDVSREQFNAHKHELSDLVMRRARHVISEDVRTHKAAEAMRAGDAALLGQLMNGSHDSLRDDFEVTNDALNTMVDIARKQSGCYGARMTGGGFGGCAVALVESDAAESFAKAVSHDYFKATGLEPQLYVCEATEGASTVS